MPSILNQQRIQMKTASNVERYYEWSTNLLLNDRVYLDSGTGIYSRAQLNDLAVYVKTVSEATKRMAEILHNGEVYSLNIEENFEEE